MKLSCIYKITNSITSKVYIGKTCEKVERRFNNHLSMARGSYCNTHLYNAIRKYGEDNFSVEIIADSIPEFLVNAYESYWIKHYNSYVNGYNSTLGGDGSSGTVWSQEVIKKRADSNRGRKRTEEQKERIRQGLKTRVLPSGFGERVSKSLKGRKLSKSHVEAISKGNKGRKCSEDCKKAISKAMKGRKFSNEHKIKISQALVDNNNANRTSVVCLDTMEVFNSVAEAGRAKGMSSYFHISSCCTGKRKTAGGYRWAWEK